MLPSTAENHNWESFYYSHISTGIDKGFTQCYQSQRVEAANGRSNLEVYGAAGFQRETSLEILFMATLLRHFECAIKNCQAVVVHTPLIPDLRRQK